MPRVTGVDIPANKRMDVALTYIYGIGPKIARELCEKADLAYDMRAKELTDEKVAQLNQIIERQAHLCQFTEV